MITKTSTTRFLSILATSFFLLVFIACEKDNLQSIPQSSKSNPHRLDLGIDDLLKYADINVTITPRSHGYIAEAKGKGTIPSGEYAGHKFQITLDGEYSGLGMGTLISGAASVKIRSERFESVMDPLLQSFCCGEGDLQQIDAEYYFTMFGQVNHITADEPHNHLFAGFATTEGTMNMNIADQSGTIVEPADPPHDPGIGLIIGFDANYVRVNLH